MSDPHNHDPDPAALDELLRAFGEESAEPDAPDRAGSDVGADVVDDPSDARPDPVDGTLAGEPAEIVIVEQEPMGEPTPPTVFRIDDYHGSKLIEQPSPPSDAVSAAVRQAGETDGDGDGGDVGDVDGPVVIAIEDGDLPDPVYVEGNLERSGTREIVFIDDDDTGDAIAPEIDREVRRGIEPRLRERRAAVKRALGRKRLRWVLFASFVMILGVAALAVLGSGLFAIQEDNVTVIGAVYADEAEVGAVVDELVGTPALLADTQGAEKALEAIPWVEAARVRVSFPHSATIEIRERQALTKYQGPDQRYRVLDRDGRVLAVLDGNPIAYVLITGPDPVDLDAGDFAPQGYAAASELAKNLTSSIRLGTTIAVTADGSRLSLFLEDGSEVRFGEARDLFNKLLRLETALANNPEREPGVIDVSTSEVTL